MQRQRDRLRTLERFQLADRLWLLDVSHRARNNVHDNKLSIIEELREAGLIIH